MEFAKAKNKIVELKSELIQVVSELKILIKFIRNTKKGIQFKPKFFTKLE